MLLVGDEAEILGLGSQIFVDYFVIFIAEESKVLDFSSLPAKSPKKHAKCLKVEPTIGMR